MSPLTNSNKEQTTKRTFLNTLLLFFFYLEIEKNFATSKNEKFCDMIKIHNAAL